MSKFYNLQSAVVEKSMLDLQISDRLSNYIALESITEPITEGIDFDKFKQAAKEKAKQIKVTLLKIIHKISDFIQDFINRIKGKEFGDVTIKGGLKFDYEKKDYEKYKAKIIKLLSLANISLFDPDSVIREAEDINSELGDIIDSPANKKDLVINRVTVERFIKLIKAAIKDFETTANQVEDRYNKVKDKKGAKDELNILIKTSFAAGKLLRIFDEDLLHINSSIPKRKNNETQKEELREEFTKEVDNKKWLSVRIMLLDHLILQANNKDEVSVEKYMEYAKKNGLPFADEKDDDYPYETDKSKWTKDYMNLMMTRMKGSPFSEKRWNHCKQVVDYIYGK